MKLLIVTTSFQLKPDEGFSPFMWELCVYLKRLGWDITVIVPHHKGMERFEIWDGVKIKRFKYLPEKFENMAYTGGIMPNIKKAPLKVFKLPFFIYSIYRELLRTTKNENFDLVNVHWLFPGSFWLNGFCKKRRVPVVITGHGTDIHLAQKFPFSVFADRALSKSSAVTINSKYMKEIITKRAIPKRVETIPMGVDTSKFSPGEQKPSGSKKMLFVGRFIRQKGVKHLLDAFTLILKEVPDSQLEIIGHGPEEANIKKLILENNLSDRVKITRPVTHNELVERYQNIRILVLPSLIGEGFGMTAAEAASCGVPTVTFGLGGTSELVINEETGLIAKQDVNGLANALIRLLRDDNLTDRLGENARKRIIDNFSWEIIASKFDNLFREIIK